MKVAVIGVGAMGRNHARVCAELPEVELSGVADLGLPSAQAVARRYGTAAFADYRQLLDDCKPDVAIVAVPTEDHLAVALDAMARGVHVLVEKPIAASVKDGERLIAAAAAAGVHLMIGHIERFNPAILALKAHLAEGELGRVFQIDARRQGPFPNRVKDVGVVIDLAVHDLDVIRYITGAEVVRVYAETEHRIHSTHEDLVAGLVRLSDGAVGTLTINWLTPTKIRELYVTGECGMFRVDYLTQDLYFFENANISGREWDALRVLRGVSEGRMIRHRVVKNEPLRVEIEAFLSAVRGEQPVPVTGLDGLKAVQLAEALVTSGNEQRPVLLEHGRVTVGS